MRTAFPVREQPTRNVLIAVSHCAKIMPSRVERVAQFSARPAVSYIERSTRSPLTLNVENEKELKLRTLANYAEWPSGRPAFSVSVLLVVHLSSALYQATATIPLYRSYLPHG
jgi:hypothetical protein